MDVGAVVTAVATLLAQRAAGSVADRLGEQAAERIRRVVQFLHNRLGGQAAARTDLAKVEADPASPDSLVVLTQLVEQGASTDEAFLEELVDLLREAAARVPGVILVTSVSGNANVGKIANFGDVRGDVSL